MVEAQRLTEIRERAYSAQIAVADGDWVGAEELRNRIEELSGDSLFLLGEIERLGGFSDVQDEVFVALSECGGWVTANDLARRTGVDGRAVAVVLKRADVVRRWNGSGFDYRLAAARPTTEETQ